MAMNAATILYDTAGNTVGVLPGAALASTQSAFAVAGSDYGATPTTRLMKVDASGYLYTADTTPSTQNVPAASILRTPLTTGSGASVSSSMVVNGSSTNVVFTWTPATTTASYTLTGLNFILSAPVFTFKGSCFGQVTSTAYNGMLVQVSSGGVFTTIATVKYNEDFLSFNDMIEVNQSGATDYLRARYTFRNAISANSGDGIKVTIRDNFAANTTGGLITSGTPNITYMQAFVEGVRLTA